MPTLKCVIALIFNFCVRQQSCSVALGRSGWSDGPVCACLAQLCSFLSDAFACLNKYVWIVKSTRTPSNSVTSVGTLVSSLVKSREQGSFSKFINRFWVFAVTRPLERLEVQAEVIVIVCNSLYGMWNVHLRMNTLYMTKFNTAV